MKRRPTKRRVESRKLLRLAREERGAELVEFAVVGLVLMMLLFGIFEFAYAMYAKHFTSYAAEQGARFAQVRGYTWISRGASADCNTSFPGFTMVYNCTAHAGDIQNYVDSLATGVGINPSQITVTTSWPGTSATGSTTPCTGSGTVNSPGCLVDVQVQYNFTFISMMHFSTVSFSAESEKTILQ